MVVPTATRKGKAGTMSATRTIKPAESEPEPLDKPTVEEVHAVLTREWQARLRLQDARAAAYERLSEKYPKAPVTKIKNLVTTSTMDHQRKYEQARRDLAVIVYRANGVLQISELARNI